MDLRTVVRTITRHWLVVSLALVATALVAVGLVLKIKPSYEVKGSMLVLTKSSGVSPEGPFEVNPLTNPAQVAAASTALVQLMMSEAYIDKMQDAGVTGTYALDIPPNASGAILDLTVEDTTPEAATASYAIVAQAVTDEAPAFQRRLNIPESTLIKADELTPASRPSTVSGGKVRVLAGVLIVGFGASFSLAFAADLLYGDNRRPLRRRRHHDDSVDDQGETPGADWPRRRQARAGAQDVVADSTDPSDDTASSVDGTGEADEDDADAEVEVGPQRHRWRRQRSA
jgi:capsular polysaccharide biosynthesis protein